MMSKNLEVFFVITFLISLFADVVLRAAWSKMYYTLGIPIFIKRISVKSQYPEIPSESLLEDKFQPEWIPLTFKQIGSHICGFREKYYTHGRLGYFAIMHGVLVFERKNKQVVVKGIANWVAIWLILYFSSVLLNSPTTFPLQITGPALFIILVIAVSYSIQFARFSKVGNFAAESWTKKHLQNSGGV